MKLTRTRTNTTDSQALPICPRCQRTFLARIALIGHLRMQCINNPTIPNSNSANPPSDSPRLTPGINSITTTIKKTTSKFSSPVTPPPPPPTTTTTTTAATTTLTSISDGDSLLNSPHCDRTCTSSIGLISLLRIHRTETGEPVLGKQTYSIDRRLNCPPCVSKFTHRIDLFGRM
ncbi:unnamed protein product [Schistocephalus solidus]|uniref:C2H2-type domain-containing protein n=1 Tax=Schistocephalus solidus TaxID=70667 RepID=A0A183TMR8_SCHSO|nr:unnamed protein product [Schistocephalus solidus]